MGWQSLSYGSEQETETTEPVPDATEEQTPQPEHAFLLPVILIAAAVVLAVVEVILFISWKKNGGK